MPIHRSGPGWPEVLVKIHGGEENGMRKTQRFLGSKD